MELLKGFCINSVVLSAKEQIYLKTIEDLNKPFGLGLKVGFTGRLYDKQVEALSSIFVEDKGIAIINCGRKFGKTELALYALYYYALTNPGSTCYYVVPENSHGRELIWNNRRLQEFLGKESYQYIAKESNVDMRLNFKNKSYIRILGSENWAAGNGLTPNFVVYDEFKVFNPKWHTQFDPNRSAKAAPLLIIGTMPAVGDRNKEQYEGVLEYCLEHNEDCAVHTFTTFDNPINMLPAQKKLTDQAIALLRSRGDEDVVQREYYSRIVPGGSRAIFPMLVDNHFKPEKQIYNEIKNDTSKLEWFCITDPGTTTCFAVLIGCINPYTRRIYILDEIYEKDRNMTSTRMMYPRMQKLMKKWYPTSDVHDDWMKVYDEAAAWFANELMHQYGVFFTPTAKHIHKKDSGISLIKDVLIHELVHINESCKNLKKEMQEYATDDKGNIPKKNDHLVDCFRYFLGAANYNMIEGLEVIAETNPEIDFKNSMRKRPRFEDETTDWTAAYESEDSWF